MVNSLILTKFVFRSIGSIGIDEVPRGFQNIPVRPFRDRKKGSEGYGDPMQHGATLQPGLPLRRLSGRPLQLSPQTNTGQGWDGSS